MSSLQYKLKTPVIKLSRIDDPSNHENPFSLKSVTDGASDSLISASGSNASKRSIFQSNYYSRIEDLFEYDNEAQIGINSNEYNLLRRQVEPGCYQYNLRKCKQPKEEIEFKYDLYKSARQENINHLLGKWKNSPEFSPEAEIKLRSQKFKRKEDKDEIWTPKKKRRSELMGSPKKKPRSELMEMAKTLEENLGLLEENDKVVHYNVIATVNDNILTIKYFQTFESGTILMNVVDCVIKDNGNETQLNGKSEKKSKGNKSRERKKNSLRNEKKLYYKCEPVKFCNGKILQKILISENEFKDESAEILQVSSETNEKVTDFPEETLPVVESDFSSDDLCNSLISQGEIDQGLEQPLNLDSRKEAFEICVDENGFIETFITNTNYYYNNNNNYDSELTKNVCDVDLNEKLKKVMADLNSDNFVKKHEASEALRLINKLLNYK